MNPIKKDEWTSELIENPHLTGQDMTVFVFEIKTNGRASENLAEIKRREGPLDCPEDASEEALSLVKNKQKETINFYFL